MAQVLYPLSLPIILPSIPDIDMTPRQSAIPLPDVSPDPLYLSPHPPPPQQPPSPIHTLPTEILAHVFFFAADAEPPLNLSAPAGRPRSSSVADLRPVRPAGRRNTVLAPPAPRLGWIRLSHVSHHWRAVALAYPALWHAVPLTIGDRWAKVALSRAQSSPLTIRLAVYPGMPGSSLLSNTNFLADALDRVHTIELSGEPVTLGRVLARLRVPAPTLQVFQVHADRATGPNEGWPLVLPRNLFEATAPRLHTIHFTGCVLPVAPAFAPPLRHASLRLRGPSPQAPSPDTVVLLRALPHIETLALAHCLPPTFGDVDALEYPNLRRLELVGALSSVADFLKLARLPRDAVLDIGAFVSDEPDASATALDLITTHMAHVEPLRTLTFECPKDGCSVRVAANTQVSEPALSCSADKANAEFYFVHGTPGVWDFPRIMRDTFAALSLRQLEVLDVSFPVPASTPEAWKPLPDLWRDTLVQCDQLRSVRVAGTHGWALCSVLTGGAGAEDTLLPKLEELVLRCVDFFHPVYLDRILLSVVRARKAGIEGVVPIKRVRLERCSSRKSVMDELKGIVETYVESDEGDA